MSQDTQKETSSTNFFQNMKSFDKLLVVVLISWSLYSIVDSITSAFQTKVVVNKITLDDIKTAQNVIDVKCTQDAEGDLQLCTLTIRKQ